MLNGARVRAGPFLVIMSEQQPTDTLSGHKGSITALRFASRGGVEWLLSGSEDGESGRQQGLCKFFSPVTMACCVATFMPGQITCV